MTSQNDLKKLIGKHDEVHNKRKVSYKVIIAAKAERGRGEQ